MKKHIANRFFTLLPILILAVMLMLPTPSMAAEQLPVELGTTVNYAILAGSGITNTGSTTINGNGLGSGGDVGTFPTTTINGFPPALQFDGIIQSDIVTQQAKSDLKTAYDDAAARTLGVHTVSEALGGGQNLTPGTYKSETSMQINGTLILDGLGDPNAVFVFQAGSTLTTASSSKIILANGAQFGRIYWQVGSSATLGSGSAFSGRIFAMTSITLNAGVNVTGQLLARNGAVTLISDFIVNPIVSTPVPSDNSSDNSSDSSTTDIIATPNAKTGDNKMNLYIIMFALFAGSVAISFATVKKTRNK